MTLALILVLIAVILFAFASFNANVGRVNLTALGLFFFAASFLVGAL